MVIGHQKQWQFLKQSAELGRLAHAYLFSGQEKLGKRKVALEWISLLFGQDISKKLHPDFISIEPQASPSAQASTGKKEIQISQIRELILKLSLRPYLAPIKSAIIDQAHQMNEEAQNCFLKTLEEPKGQALLILITDWPETLFPTIRSRCEMVKFYPVPKLEIENYLADQDISKEKAKEIAKLSLGRPGIAIDFISNPQKLENQKKIIKELIEISNLPLANRFQYAKEISRSGNLREILEIWLNYFRNIFIEKCSSPDDEQIKEYSFSKLKNILKQIQNTNFLISTTNVNPRLALEILMLEL
ncbi:MAG: hypothetical protein QME61_03015 [Patescibacteria group bacterium]|nr:hypothetical protein [Patescibacteria group bacterium]